MPVPTYDRFIEPVLRFLATKPDGVKAADAQDAAAKRLGLSDEDRQERLPSGQQAVYKNRAGWAHDRLKRIGYSESVRRGWWQLTAAGMSFAQAHPQPLSDEEVVRIAATFRDSKVSEPQDLALTPVAPEGITESPDDRLNRAYAELRRAVADELLDLLGRVSPTYFESIVLDLLHRMGYGATRDDLKRVGSSGDAGIDGIISLDKLGLEKVYVQAKRWQGTVGRPDVQGFYGALAGQRAKKGVFITTSTYSPQAVDFVRTVEGIVLIDGKRLADLMIDHEIGVSMTRTIRIPKIDSDYFEGEAG